MTRRREDEALEVLASVEALSIDEPRVLTQRNEIKFSIIYERDNAICWWDLLRRGKSNGTKTLRRLLLGAGNQAIQ